MSSCRASESAFGSCNAVSAFFSWMLFKLAFRESVALSNVLATRLSCVMVASALQPSVSTVFSALVAASANASMMSFTPSAPRIRLLQFAAVFGSVEHGFAGRAEFRERLPACGQCFLLLVAVNAHAGTAMPR